MSWPAGQAALVTGAGSGIGRGVAHALVAAGVKVAIVDISEERLAQTEKSLTESGGTAFAIPFDISKLDQWEAVVDRAEDALGPISILCNIAGVNGGGRADQTSIAQWRWVYGINIDAQFASVSALLRRWKERGGKAHIVNTASIAGISPVAGAGAIAYASSKYACMGFALLLREELRSTDIGVSLLIPGSVATPINVNAAEVESESIGTEPNYDLAKANGALLQQGADPAKVGEQVVEAITNGDFYIVTHREWGEFAAQANRELEDAYANFDGRNGPDPVAAAMSSGEFTIST